MVRSPHTTTVGRRAEPTSSTQEQHARALRAHPLRSSCCSTIWPCASCRGKLQGGVFVLPAHTTTPLHLSGLGSRFGSERKRQREDHVLARVQFSELGLVGRCKPTIILTLATSV